MNDAADKPEATRPSAGALLSDARAATDMTRVAVAEALHLDPALVDAMEADDYDRLGAPVFARGHLKKYALLLSLNEDEVLACYDAGQDDAELPPVVAAITRKPLSAALPPGWLAIAALLLGVVALLVWFLSGDKDVVASSPSANNVGPVQTVALAELPEENSAPFILPAREDTEAPDEPIPQTAATAEVEEAVQPAVDVLVLTYTADCWTEVRDQAAQRLYSATAPSGTRLVLEGQSPFDLVIGNRRAVRIELNGESVAIPGNAIRGRTARFSTPASAN